MKYYIRPMRHQLLTSKQYTQEYKPQNTNTYKLPLVLQVLLVSYQHLDDKMLLFQNHLCKQYLYCS
ncbi:MAG: hypothetical protein LBE12_19625 [Planctomycetaceae bacterium]|nr:hypothetical protein [Planctomycetaceae bacterium]